MADKALVSFETAVEKLTASYVKDVNGYVENAKAASKRRASELAKAIQKLKAPPGQSGEVLSGIINGVISTEGKVLKDSGLGTDEKHRTRRSARPPAGGPR